MQFGPAKALLNGMAQLWYVWLILGLVLIGRLVFYLLEQQKLAKSGIADIDRMDGKTFEKYLKVFFEKLGYKVERTKYIGDYGADLVTTNNGVKTVIHNHWCQVYTIDRCHPEKSWPNRLTTDGEMRGSGDRAIESYMKRLIIKTAWGREQSSRLKGVSMQGFSTKRF
jgi:hypothetical protein